MRLTRTVLCSVAVMLLATAPLAATPLPTRATPPEIQDAVPDAGGRGGAPDADGPLVVQAPGDVEISIRITPTLKTEELRVYADSGSHFRSTTIGLNGVESDPLHRFTWRAFPAGEYEVVGMLVDSDGASQIVVRGALKVLR